jgi:hypothetical protein
MFEKIYHLLRKWEHDPSVTCVVVSGAGKKAFCSGTSICYQTNLNPSIMFESVENKNRNDDSITPIYGKTKCCILIDAKNEQEAI